FKNFLFRFPFGNGLQSYNLFQIPSKFIFVNFSVFSVVLKERFCCIASPNIILFWCLANELYLICGAKIEIKILNFLTICKHFFKLLFKQLIDNNLKHELFLHYMGL